jgi:hypothetical protein
MPNPPINKSGHLTASILLQASVARASSDPLRRLFISSFWPSIIENSAPLRISRSSTSAPGTRAVSICNHGIMRCFYAGSVESCAARSSTGGLRAAANFAADRSGSLTYSIALPDIHKIRRLIDRRVFAEMFAD